MLKKKIQGKEILRAWPHLLFQTYLAHIDSVKLPLFSCNIEIRICRTELTKTDETTKDSSLTNFVNFKCGPSNRNLVLLHSL